MTAGVLLHGCDLLVEQALEVALSGAGYATTVWEATRSTCVAGEDRLLVLAGPTGSALCRAGCSRCLVHWRQHHPALPVVLVGRDDSGDDWPVRWDGTTADLLGCLGAAAEGRRPA